MLRARPLLLQLVACTPPAAGLACFSTFGISNSGSKRETCFGLSCISCMRCGQVVLCTGGLLIRALLSMQHFKYPKHHGVKLDLLCHGFCEDCCSHLHFRSETVEGLDEKEWYANPRHTRDWFDCLLATWLCMVSSL